MPYFLVTLPYDKGWKVSIDGKDVPTFPALEALIGFAVPEGAHTVTLRYESPGWMLGLGIAAGALVLLLITLAVDKKYRRAYGIFSSKKKDMYAVAWNSYFHVTWITRFTSSGNAFQGTATEETQRRTEFVPENTAYVSEKKDTANPEDEQRKENS